MHGLAPHDPSYFAGQYGPAGHGTIQLQPGLHPPASYAGGAVPDSSHLAQPAQLSAAPAPGPATPRLRWGRLLVLILGVGLVAFAVTNLVSSATSPARDAGAGGAASQKGDDARPGSAGGPATGIDPAADPTSGLDLPSIDTPPTPSGAGVPMINSTSTTKHPTPTGAGTNASRSHSTGARSSKATNGSRSGAQRPATGGGAGQGNRPSTAQGGAAGPDSSLPYTGASAWIAAVIGVLALAAGMLLQLKALQIGEAASLYRRGPLLRPLWLIGLTLRNAPQAFAWTLRNAPALHEFMERAREALDARGDGAEEFIAARRA